MTLPSLHIGSRDQKIAYVQTQGVGTGVVFLGGFKSDMEGSKATHLEDLCRTEGRPFLRFDYTGHGQSSGAFTDGCIGDWTQDAIDIIHAKTSGPQILVGSSMGGWISLLFARAHPDRVAGLLGIAAAPDFTEDSMWAGFDADQRAALMTDGVVHLPSDYGDPYPITQRLIEDGRQQLVLRSPLEFAFPVRLVQGSADNAVTRDTALRLFDHITASDVQLQFAKGADHSFSDPARLAIIAAHLRDLCAAADGRH